MSIIAPSPRLEPPHFKTKVAGGDGNFTQPWQDWFTLLKNLVNLTAVIVGTHADRTDTNAAQTPVGTLFWEFDRSSLYLMTVGPDPVTPDTPASWVYIAGHMSGQTSDAPTDLTGADIFFQFQDFTTSHNVIWDGSGWLFNAGDSGGGYLVEFGSGISPTNGWVPCSGIPTSYLTVGATLTLTPFTTPVLVGDWYFRR